MNESKLYEAIEAALSGAQHIEEVAGMIISDAREAGHDGDWDQYRTQIDSYGCTIASTIDAIETILFHLLEIHKEEGKTAARLDEIEEAAKAIAIIERPELNDGFFNTPEAIPEGVEIIPDPDKIYPEGWKAWKEAEK